MNRPRCCPFARIAHGVALALALAATTPAAAQDPRPKVSETAATHFKRGVELYDEADFSTALVEFRRAYETMPDFRVLYNIAQAEYQLQRYASALVSFKKYLAEGGASVSAARRAEVEREVAKLEGRVARVRIASRTPAEVFVDEEPVGRTPLREPLVVSAGQHQIRVARADGPAFVKRIELAGGDDLALTVDGAEATNGGAPSARGDINAGPTDRGPSESKGVDPRVIAWSATGAVAVSAAIVGVLALSADDDLEKKRGKPPGTVTATELDDASSKTKTLALVTDVLTGAAVAGAGVSLYLTLKPPSRASTAWHVGPLGASGVSLRRTF